MLRNKTTDFTGQSFYIGLDVHKKSWTITVRTSGLEVAHFTQEPDVDQLHRYLNKRYPGARFYSAYEAGFCGTRIHTLLCQAGINNIIIHPADLPKTDKQQKNKTDLHDSRAAARYLEAGLLKGIHILSAEQQQRRALFRLRQTQVKDLTRATNRLRSFLHFFGIQVPTEYENKKYLSNRFLNWIRSITSLTQEGMDTLNQYIDDVEYHRKQLLEITKKVRHVIMETYGQQYRSMLSVPGYGPIITSALLAETGNLRRFDGQPDHYSSYLGLTPAEHSSGETVYSTRIQPRCNSYLRPLLIEAAWVAIRKCPVLLAYYKKHFYKNDKKAIVKVARKLALIAKAVAIKQTRYQPEKAFQQNISS